jgi:hypothetical protein
MRWTADSIIAAMNFKKFVRLEDIGDQDIDMILIDVAWRSIRPSFDISITAWAKRTSTPRGVPVLPVDWRHVVGVFLPCLKIQLANLTVGQTLTLPLVLRGLVTT